MMLALLLGPGSHVDFGLSPSKEQLAIVTVVTVQWLTSTFYLKHFKTYLAVQFL